MKTLLKTFIYTGGIIAAIAAVSIATGAPAQIVQILNGSSIVGSSNGLPVNVVAGSSISIGAITLASGAVASGAYASGSIASGALAAGSVASGAMVDLGAKADATCATAAGTCSLIALLKYLNTAFSINNIVTSTTTTVKSGAGVLHGINVNTLGSIASVATVYDNTAGSGTKIATIDTLAASGKQGWNQYDIVFATGLTIVTTGTSPPDITVSYK